MSLCLEACRSLALWRGPGANVVGARERGGCVVLRWVPGLLPCFSEGAYEGRQVQRQYFVILHGVFEAGTGFWAQRVSLPDVSEGVFKLSERRIGLDKDYLCGHCWWENRRICTSSLQACDPPLRPGWIFNQGCIYFCSREREAFGI